MEIKRRGWRDRRWGSVVRERAVVVVGRRRCDQGRLVQAGLCVPCRRPGGGARPPDPGPRDIRGLGGRGRFISIPGLEYAFWWRYWPSVSAGLGRRRAGCCRSRRWQPLRLRVPEAHGLRGWRTDRRRLPALGAGGPRPGHRRAVRPLPAAQNTRFGLLRPPCKYSGRRIRVLVEKQGCVSAGLDRLSVAYRAIWLDGNPDVTRRDCRRPHARHPQ